MIKFTENKLIIEIETSSPKEEFVAITNSLIELLQSANQDTGNNTKDTALNMLRSMVLDENQIKAA